jgi:hypothetical protein
MKAIILLRHVPGAEPGGGDRQLPLLCHPHRQRGGQQGCLRRYGVLRQVSHIMMVRAFFLAHTSYFFHPVPKTCQKKKQEDIYDLNCRLTEKEISLHYLKIQFQIGQLRLERGSSRPLQAGKEGGGDFTGT